MTAAIIILLLLALLFGLWTVIEGLFWLTVIIVAVIVITGFVGRSAFAKRR
ncbi:hypothetical protein BH23ACT2_BH23ACT2_25020 [soil metagenome]